MKEGSGMPSTPNTLFLRRSPRSSKVLVLTATPIWPNIHGIAEQYHKFEKIAEVMENKEMPLSSYTWFGQHPDAKLTDVQRKTLIDWAEAQMTMIETTYPADSLVQVKSEKRWVVNCELWV